MASEIVVKHVHIYHLYLWISLIHFLLRVLFLTDEQTRRKHYGPKSFCLGHYKNEA